MRALLNLCLPTDTDRCTDKETIGTQGNSDQLAAPTGEEVGACAYYM